MSVIVPLSSIIIGDRARKIILDYDINLLAEDIAARGLYHAPVMEFDGKTLVAGERRIHAMIKLHEDDTEFSYNGEIVPHKHIPIVHLAELHKADYAEAEIMENVLRVRLSASERVDATRALYRLRELQNGGNYTYKDAAIELYGTSTQHTAVRDDILIAENCNLPGMQESTSRKRSLGIIRAHNLVKARRDLKYPSRSKFPVKDDGQFKRYKGNYDIELPKMPNRTFSCIISRHPTAALMPTYGVVPPRRMREAYYTLLLKEGRRIGQLGVHLFCEIPPPDFHICRAIGEHLYWKAFPVPIIWHFKDGKEPWGDAGPAVRHSQWMLFVRGKFDLHLANRQSVISAETVSDLFKEFISWGCEPGDRVLDTLATDDALFTAAKSTHTAGTIIDVT